MKHQTLKLFNTRQDARDYRYKNGTGGWIFSADDESVNVLFPPDVCPYAIFHHPLTKGLSGDLLSN
jgi:hypothetical protein